MIFSHVLYQLSYLGAGPAEDPGAVEAGVIKARSRPVQEAAPARNTGPDRPKRSSGPGVDPAKRRTGAMRITSLLGAPVLAAALVCPPARAQTDATNGLRPPSAFDNMTDRAARSRALFTEAAKVLTSPRCMNCHPAGDHPTQGADHHAHQPPVARGPIDDGARPARPAT